MCVICGKRKPRRGRLDCSTCSDRKKASAAAERAERIKDKRCVVCGDKAAKGKRKCRLCNMAHNTTCAERYQASKDRGVCPRCTERKPSPNRTFCKDCLVRYATVRRNRIRRYRRRAVRITEWRRIWASDPQLVAQRFEQLMRGHKTA